MSNADIEARITNIIIEQFGCDHEDLKPLTTFIHDLDANEIDIIEMAMTIEDEFDIVISDEEIESIETVQDLINFVEEKVDGINS